MKPGRDPYGTTLGAAHDECDVVVIGSSPLLLVAATLAAAGGKRVVLVEDCAELGGAWRCAPWGGMVDVEQGAHYLYCSPIAYGFLSSLGVQLERMLPVPFAVRFGRRLPMWTEHNVGRLIEAIRDRHRNRTMWELRRLVTYGRYLYPVGGAQELVHSLAAGAITTGVEIRTEAPVVGIATFGRSTGRHVVCELDSGILRTRRVITGESLRLKSLSDGCATYRPSWTETSKTHVLVKFDREQCRALSYAEFVGHPVLRRVALAHRPAGDQVVWTVEVPNSARWSAEDAIVASTRALHQVGLTRTANAPSAGTVTTYSGSYWSPEDRARLAPITRDWLSVLTSWVCFGDSLVHFLRRRGR